MRPRSPIEMMVDEACGFDPSEPVKRKKLTPKKNQILLRCKCGREIIAPRVSIDPKQAVVLEGPCNTCHGEFAVRYLDKNGKEVIPSPAPAQPDLPKG